MATGNSHSICKRNCRLAKSNECRRLRDGFRLRQDPSVTCERGDAIESQDRASLESAGDSPYLRKCCQQVLSDARSGSVQLEECVLIRLGRIDFAVAAPKYVRAVSKYDMVQENPELKLRPTKERNARQLRRIRIVTRLARPRRRSFWGLARAAKSFV